MKKIILLFVALIGFAYAQDSTRVELVKKPSYVLKFAPRIFSPRFSFEKVKSEKSTIGFDFRAHAYWVPQSARVEFFYRYYVNEPAPLGFYIHPKIALGYFDYALVGLNTKGIYAGAGFAIGGQYNIGKKNAVIDVFGGVQIIPPFFIDKEVRNNRGLNQYEYLLLHYTLIASPLEFGLRFGFIGKKYVAKPILFEDNEIY